MLQFPAVLLHHQTKTGSHFDWLLADAATPDGLLRSFRVPWPSRFWRAAGCFTIEPIQPHRRVYLTYEGPISDDRGQVQRVDQGTFLPLLWTESRIELDLRFTFYSGRISLERISESKWQLACVQSATV